MAAECANPLLLGFLKEWRDLAIERNSKGATTYKRAYDSMKACPLTFSHPSEAQQLHGIGAKLCEKLTDALKKHCEANGLPLPKKSRKRQSLEGLQPPTEEAPAPKKSRKAKPYVPKHRSGAYAILIALASLHEDSDQSLTKSEVQILAQEHCESSFTVPSEPGKFHTAWASMKTLEDKELVLSKGRPSRKYRLSEEGQELAQRLLNVNSNTDRPTNTANKDKDEPSRTEPSRMNRVKPKKAKATAAAPVQPENYLDLEDDDLDDFPVAKLPTLSDATRAAASARSYHEALHASSSTGAGETGQRLGGAPIDKYGTFNPRKERPKPSLPEIVSLDSSPEPEPAPRTGGASWSFDTSHRQPASGPKSKSTSKAVPGPVAAAAESIQPPRPAKDTFPSFQPIRVEPGTFTVQLVIDSREVRAKDDRDYIAKELTKKGVTPITRALELGDFFWVAKLHDPSFPSRHGEEGTEIALDHIIERKRLDDLIASVKDRRFHEQKFRLRRSGVKNVTYLIEEITLSGEHATRYHDMMETAIGETQILDGYFIKRTHKLDDSIRYLARMTTLLKSVYEDKPLLVIPSKYLDSKTYLPFITHLRATQPEKSYNITYPSFASLASKSDSTTLRDVYLKMLMCTRGLSGEKAIEVQKIWSTPRALVEALEACGEGKEREGLLEGRLGKHPVGRKKVGRMLSAKVAGIWGGGGG